jgi:hypothetical protein
MNERIGKHLAERGLDAGLPPRVIFVQRGGQFGPDELSIDGSHTLTLWISASSGFARLGATIRMQYEGVVY